MKWLEIIDQNNSCRLELWKLEDIQKIQESEHCIIFEFRNNDIIYLWLLSEEKVYATMQFIKRFIKSDKTMMAITGEIKEK